MTPRFSGKVMVITGAAQGIGKRVAELAGAEGGRLVLVDIAGYVHEVAAELRQRKWRSCRCRLTWKPGRAPRVSWRLPTGSMAASTC